MKYSTIVVGTDGSETSLAAVTTAADLASATATPLLVVCAHHPLSARDQAARTPGLDDTRFRVTGSEAAEKALAAGVSAAEGAGATDVEGLLVVGDAVNALLTTAREHAPALVVVGNRGMNRLSGRLLGSIPSDIAFRADCDVLIAHTT